MAALAESWNDSMRRPSGLDVELLLDRKYAVLYGLDCLKDALPAYTNIWPNNTSLLRVMQELEDLNNHEGDLVAFYQQERPLVVRSEAVWRAALAYSGNLQPTAGNQWVVKEGAATMVARGLADLLKDPWRGAIDAVDMASGAIRIAGLLVDFPMRERKHFLDAVHRAVGEAQAVARDMGYPTLQGNDMAIPYGIMLREQTRQMLASAWRYGIEDELQQERHQEALADLSEITEAMTYVNATSAPKRSTDKRSITPFEAAVANRQNVGGFLVALLEAPGRVGGRKKTAPTAAVPLSAKRIPNFSWNAAKLSDLPAADLHELRRRLEVDPANKSKSSRGGIWTKATEKKFSALAWAHYHQEQERRKATKTELALPPVAAQETPSTSYLSKGMPPMGKLYAIPPIKAAPREGWRDKEGNEFALPWGNPVPRGTLPPFKPKVGAKKTTKTVAGTIKAPEEDFGGAAWGPPLLGKAGSIRWVGPETGRAVANGVATYRNAKNSVRLVLYEKSTPRAALQLADHHDGTAEIVYVYASPSFRRKGLATQLIKVARTLFSKVTHSEDLTRDGAEWAEKVGAKLEWSLRTPGNLSVEAISRLIRSLAKMPLTQQRHLISQLRANPGLEFFLAAVPGLAKELADAEASANRTPEQVADDLASDIAYWWWSEGVDQDNFVERWNESRDTSLEFMEGDYEHIAQEWLRLYGAQLRSGREDGSGRRGYDIARKYRITQTANGLFRSYIRDAARAAEEEEGAEEAVAPRKELPEEEREASRQSAQRLGIPGELQRSGLPPGVDPGAFERALERRGGDDDDEVLGVSRHRRNYAASRLGRSSGRVGAMIPEAELHKLRAEIASGGNPYLRRFSAINHGTIEAMRARRELVSNFSWAIPDEKAIQALVKTSPLIEIGAGTGYWARLVHEAGGDIVAFDGTLPGAPENRYHPNPISWFDVQIGGPEQAARYPERTLFLCWPPCNTSFANDTLAQYEKAGGQRLIYVGEGQWGCTGDDAFFERLDKNWVQEGFLYIPEWDGIHDGMMIYQRRKKEAVGAWPLLPSRRVKGPRFDAQPILDSATGIATRYYDKIEEIPDDDDYHEVYHGRKVRWLGSPGYMLKVAASRVLPMIENSWYPNQLARYMQAIEDGDLLEPPAARAYIVDAGSIEASQERVDEGELEEPFDESDLGEPYVVLADGNHRGFAALLSGEPYLWVYVGENYRDAVRDLLE